MTSRLMHPPERSSLPASGQAEVPFPSTFGVTAPVAAGMPARPLKLVIQIPCLNEETTLPQTLADLPRAIPGIAAIETLVIDDGSADRTSDVARALGVTRVVRFTARRGLAQAFARGLWEALDMGADIVVNTDADNQYRGEDVARLVAPILAGQADMVIGDRQIDQVAAFSPLKKALQKLGSWVVGKLANVQVPDTTSGFRAYSRNAALRLKVVSDFTYTVETVIQATHKNIVLASVPVRTNPVTRPSRLFHSTVHYIQRSIATMLRMYVVYRPLRFFLSLSSVFLVASAALFLRFLAIYLSAGHGVQTGHVQSLIVAGVLAMVGVLLMALGVISDLIATNRRVLEEILVSARTLRLEESTRRKQP